MRHQLTQEWSIELDDEYDRHLVEGDLQLISRTSPRTIWLAVWSPPPEEKPTDVLAWIKEEANPNPEWVVEEQGRDPEELRYASWYQEPGERGTQYALYAYTVRRGSYVQAAFISDDSSDRDWAVETGRSLRYSK